MGLFAILGAAEDRGAVGQKWISKDQGSHRAARIPAESVTSIHKQPQAFHVVFDTRAGSVQDAPIEFAQYAKPHFKIGIYRPGQGRRTSAMLIDDVTVTN